MPIIKFPEVESADDNGLVALGGDLELDSLLLAYQCGIYPWPIGDEYPLAWFSPDPRGLINIKNIHYPKSFLKELRKQSFSVSINQSFKEVITKCQAVHTHTSDGTWITDDIVNGYTQMHLNKFAYSIEVKNIESGKLVGGLYGVKLGNYISGESMFHTETNASKVALFVVLQNLKIQKIKFLDTQMVTKATKAFGATEVKRSRFIKEMKKEMIKFDLNLESFITDTNVLLTYI